MPDPNLRSIAFYMGKPGHEMYAVLTNKIVNVTGQMDQLRKAASRPDFVGVVTKAPATKWSGQFWMDVNPDTRPYWAYGGDASATPEIAAVKLRAKAAKAKADEKAVLTNAVVYLERELKSHDWFSSFSDEYAKTLAGDAHMKLITALLEKVPHDVGLRLWKKYAPKEYTKDPYSKTFVTASRVAARYLTKVAYQEPKGVIVRTNGGRLSMQSIPTDPPYNQSYETYLLRGGVKALAAGTAIVQQYADKIKNMGLHEAHTFVDEEITKRAKVRGQWHYYIMPD